MALIKCPECGQDISDKALACPHCGCPMNASAQAQEQTDLLTSLGINKYGEPINASAQVQGQQISMTSNFSVKRVLKGVAWGVAIAVVISVLAAVSKPEPRVPITEYQQGYNAGVKDVQETHKKDGGFVTALGSIAVQLLPGDPNKSADWNAGYRDGVWAEANKRNK